jgi:peptidoglycan/LPS O-acetylase OafA/YrhL
MAWPLLVASIAFVAISLALQAAHFSLFHPNPRKVWWIFWPTLEAVLWASLLLAYLAVRLPWPKWVDSTLAYGGTLSFSLYMWHPTVLNLFERFYGMPPQRTALFVVLHIMAVTATTVLVSVLSYNVIERPFLDIRRSYGVVRPQPQEMGRIEILPRRKSRLDLGSELPRRNAAVDE